MTDDILTKYRFNRRFGGNLPVVVDVETGGVNATKDALLEIAAVTISINEEGILSPKETHAFNITPFEGANLNPESLKITGIDPYHPFRFAVPESDALEKTFAAINEELKLYQCQRAVLVGHNATFDLSFIQAAAKRCKLHNHPFHKFTCMDTATLGGLAYGETVLARIMRRAKIAFNKNEAHSAIYDAEKTAELFCKIVNNWHLSGIFQWPGSGTPPPQSIHSLKETASKD